MTNKKLKLAAMSVALTACVAAQPMAAHAVEGPDPAEDNAAPQAEPAPVEGETAEGEVEGEEGKQEEFTPPPVNEEAKSEEQAPAFGPGTKTDDITIDYKPAEKPEQPGKSGEDGEADGSEGSGETDETENPDGTYVKGDVIDNSKKDEATGKDGKIGTATKEETPDSSSSTTVVDPDAEVKKGDPVVGKDEDGNTTITTPTETTGTETTTTTGTGKADSSTTITDTKKGEEIDLDDELGKDVRPDWKTDKDAKLGGYTVDKVEPAKDGNSKTLTLKKTSEPETKEMSAEDVAKLLDVPEDGVEKKTDDEGKTTYILKKEETSTDENGNTVTRVTYYKITGNTVETTTETTLKLKVEKGTVDVDEKDLTTEIELPSITAKNTDETKTDVIEISSEKLGEMLKDEYYNNDTGEYVYTETDANGKEYTYKVKKTEDTKPLTNKQLADRLGEGFTGDDNGVYYKGEKLNLDQMEAVRKTLSYTVEVTEVTKTPGQVEGGQESIKSAEETAKLEAIKAALTDAAKKTGINVDSEDFKNQLNTIDPTGKGQLNLSYTDADGNVHTVTLRYDGATVSAPQPGSSDPSKDTETRKDVTDNVITGTAYVTGSNTWTESGSLNGTYVKPGSGELPSFDGWTIASKDPEKGTTTYKKEETVTSPDGTSTKITRTCTITESSASLSDTEKEEIAWAELLNQHPEYKNKDELKAAGYNINISSMDFSGIKRVEWTIDTLSESTKTDTKDLNDKLVIPGGKNWSIDENAGTITVDGNIYRNVTKTDDGYTCTVEDKNGVKTTYTFTKQAGAPLTPEEIQTALAGQYSVSADSIRLNADGKTATFTKGNETITVDYSTLSETLTVRKDVHTSSSVTDIIKDNKDLEKAYDELWKQIQEIQSKLLPGEELWIGKTKIDSTTKKEDIIKYFTKAISPENMSKDELIKALQEQERIAKNSTYVANKGSDYEETKKNYYSGEKTDEFKSFSKAPDGSKIEVYWKSTWLWYGYYYYTDANGQEVRVDNNTVHSEEQRDDIGHLDLASGSKLDLLPDEDGKVDQTDCVLVSKNLKLEWNYDAGNLVNGKGNQPVGLDSKISWDDEGGKGDGHYEYDRGNSNNCPDKSAYYKLTGTVAYDPIKENGSIKLYQGQRGDYWTPGISAEDEAINAYLKATGSNKTAASLTKKERDAIVGTYVVQIGTTGTNSTGESGYQVYLKSSELTAYGYMTRDANTCINSTYKRQDGTWGYVGGYDLMISELTQVSEGKVVGQTESTIKTITAPLSIRSSQDFAKRLLELNKQTTTTHKTGEGATAYGENTSGDFDGTYTQKKSETVEGSGTGKGHYTTFTEVLKKIFSGSGSKEHDEGSVSYTHRTTDKVNTTPVSKETVTTTDAHVGYNYTSIETRTVTVNGEETVIVPPVTPPETPVEDETPDEVVTPETPKLPPVQDATPDAPVLPSDAVLPAVQDALPQTGVNWMAALGMAFSGMLLTIAGAFASLKYKEKH
jgi:hypothetical protein